MPRLENPVVTRFAYYDRNTVKRSISFKGDALAPHALTVRATYTVPSASKAFAEFFFTDLLRLTAAGTPGSPINFISHTPDGGAPAAIFLARLLSTQNAINDTVKHAQGVFLLANDDDAFTLSTQDGSTTGTVFYEVRAHIVEFDR